VTARFRRKSTTEDKQIVDAETNAAATTALILLVASSDYFSDALFEVLTVTIRAPFRVIEATMHRVRSVLDVIAAIVSQYIAHKAQHLFQVTANILARLQ
jgi:hypothetical protein